MQKALFKIVKVTTNHPVQPGNKGYLLLPNLKVRLNVDSKCPCGKGRNIQIRGVTTGLGALPEVQCVQSTSCTERSANIVGLVSR